MTSITGEWAPNPDELAMSDKMNSRRSDRLNARTVDSDELGEVDEIDEALSAGIPAHRRASEMSDLDFAQLTERSSPEIKTYGPGEVTPLDELLNAQPAAPAAEDAAALKAEVARLQSVVDRLETDIARYLARYAELDESRADVVLNGGNIEKLHNDLRDAEQMVKSLTAAVEPTKAMLAKAKTASRNATVGRQAVAAKTEHYAPLADAYETMFELLAGVCHTAKVIDEHMLAIEGTNMAALAAGRADLVIDARAIRRAVVDTIGTMRASVVVPVRMGETDEAFEVRLWSVVETNARKDPRSKSNKTIGKAMLTDCRAMHIERHANEDGKAYRARQWAAAAITLHSQRSKDESDADHRLRLRDALAKRLQVDRKGESDDAYQLRVGNAHALSFSGYDQSDPLKDVAEKAMKATRKHALGLEPTALHRQHMNVRELAPLPGDTNVVRRIGRRE
ncbi:MULTISPECIES: hypothetical protein [unclassified Mesorhizobium]|uniref:hypothetical protein n=1 Tax=unclassified Mesorhizobium TaxID=325217 RepID=UPI00333BA77F